MLFTCTTMAQHPKSWPKSTGELLPNLLFKIAKEHPDLIWTEYPINPEDANDGYRKVAYREFANAVHTLAWWIETNVGKPKTNNGKETLVYMGPNDVMFGIVALASSMAGYKTLFPRPRHSIEGTVALIDSVDGKILLTSSTPFPFSSEILERRTMASFQLPSVEDLLSAQTSSYPYNKTFDQHKHEPLLVLHTSGTTGFPKPIIWTHEWPHSFAQSLYLPNPKGFERMDKHLCSVQSRFILFFPPFHCSGFHGSLLYPLLSGAIAIWPPSDLAPPEQLVNVINALDIIGAPVQSASLSPPLVEFLASEPNLLSRIAAKLSSVTFAGGDVSLEAGNTIAEKMPMWDAVGSTEVGLWPTLRKLGPSNAENLDEHWHYMHFHPAMNLRFERVSEDEKGGVYEAIMVRNQGKGAWVQPIFKIFPDLKKVSLHDLFTRHPKSSYHWKYYGRTDDLLTFITGEKWHPGGAEQRIGDDPSVVEAMMVGNRRASGALIVRLEQGRKLDDLQGVLEQVNRDSPVFARVKRDMILSVEKPFLKTAKGSVQKKAMLDWYRNELDELYAPEHANAVMP